MSDTQRSRAQVLALMADNVVGAISAQDLRDWVVTVMEPEFKYAGDFWAEPQGIYTTTADSARGWKLYSQTVMVDTTWHDILYMDPSTGFWSHAHASVSTRNGMVGLCMNTYASNDSDAEILLQGLVYNSRFSDYFNGQHGRPVFLASITSLGSATMSIGAQSDYILGWVVKTSDADGLSDTSKWYFCPGRWTITGN